MLTIAMVKDKKSWSMLKRAMKVTQWAQTVLVLLVTIVFPILIGALSNIWANGSPNSSMAGWFLLFVGFLQLVFGGYAFISKAVCPESTMTQLIEVEEELGAKNAELARREEGYRLIRASFNQLNAQTCLISGTQIEQEWCKSGFEAGLKPIMETLLRNIHKVMGVTSSVYTLEVYLADHLQLSIEQSPPDIGLKLSFFYGCSVSDNEVTYLLHNKTSPVWTAYQTNTACTQHILNNRHLFYDGLVPKAGVYFRTYAVTPVYPACSDRLAPLGALLLTSMQEEAFAPDVLDTMAFFSSIISTFLYSYQGCLFRRIENMANQAAGPKEEAVIATAPKSASQPEAH